MPGGLAAHLLRRDAEDAADGADAELLGLDELALVGAMVMGWNFAPSPSTAMSRRPR
jgi:hypothetical protein